MNFQFFKIIFVLRFISVSWSYSQDIASLRYFTQNDVNSVNGSYEYDRKKLYVNPV